MILTLIWGPYDIFDLAMTLIYYKITINPINFNIKSSIYITKQLQINFWVPKSNSLTKITPKSVLEIGLSRGVPWKIGRFWNPCIFLIKWSKLMIFDPPFKGPWQKCAKKGFLGNFHKSQLETVSRSKFDEKFEFLTQKWFWP